MGKYLYTIIIAAIAIAGIAIATSCTKTDYTGPTLASDSSNYKRTFTINPGEKANLVSKFLNPEALSYEWTMDGNVLASEGSSYQFSSNDPGCYIITQRIYNSIAEVKIDYYIVVRGGYDNGAFIYTNNEDGAAIGYVSRDYSTVDGNAYQTANPGKTLGKKISCANSFYGKTYVISESEGLIVLNSITLKEIGRLPKLPAGPNFIINVDRNNALLSTDDGVYRISLNPLALGERIQNLSGRVGMMVNNGNYILALTLNHGVIAINPTSYLLARTLKVGKSGLTTDLSGNTWTSYTDTLYRISNNLLVTKYILNVSGTKHFWVASSWNPWNEGTLTRSPIENAMYYIVANPDGTPSRELVKVNLNSLNQYITITPFITLPENRNFSGIGFRLNSDNNIVCSTVDNNGANPQMDVYRGGDATFVQSVPVSATNAKSILYNRVK